MKKQIRIFLAGLLIIIPFAVTTWVIWTIATKLGALGSALLGADWLKKSIPVEEDATREWILSLAGAVVILVVVYLVGLFTNLLMFRRLLNWAELLIQRVPGAKTIYQSVRDLLKLFGSDSGKMGKVVLYHPNGGEMAMLGVLTNENPSGLEELGDHDMVALYLPLAYMLGGPIVYVPRKNLRELDMPVEKALKLCATAEVGAKAVESMVHIHMPAKR